MDESTWNGKPRNRGFHIDKYTSVDALLTSGEDITTMVSHLYWLYRKGRQEPEMVRVMQFKEGGMWCQQCESRSGSDVLSISGTDQLLSVTKPLDVSLELTHEL